MLVSSAAACLSFLGLGVNCCVCCIPTACCSVLIFIVTVIGIILSWLEGISLVFAFIVDAVLGGALVCWIWPMTAAVENIINQAVNFCISCLHSGLG